MTQADVPAAQLDPSPPGVGQAARFTDAAGIISAALDLTA